MYVSVSNSSSLNPPAEFRPVRAGLGLFDSGLDFSGWSTAEWTAVIVGGYLLLSLAGDASRTTRKISQKARRAGASRRRRGELQKELAAL